MWDIIKCNVSNLIRTYTYWDNLSSFSKFNSVHEVCRTMRRFIHPEIWKRHAFFKSFWRLCLWLRKCLMCPLVIMNVRQFRSLTPIILIRKENLNVLVWFWPLLTKIQVSHFGWHPLTWKGLSFSSGRLCIKTTCYFSYKMRKNNFYFMPRKTRGKTSLQSFWANFSIPSNWKFIGFSQRRNISTRKKWWTHRTTVSSLRPHYTYC